MHLKRALDQFRLAVTTERDLCRKYGANSWSVARIRSMDDTLDADTRDAYWKASEILAAKHLLFHWKLPGGSAGPTAGRRQGDPDFLVGVPGPDAADRAKH